MPCNNLGTCTTVGKRREGWTASKGLVYVQVYISQLALQCTWLGIILYSVSDLQHAVYWCKQRSWDEKSTILQKFQEAWRYDTVDHFMLTNVFLVLHHQIHTLIFYVSLFAFA